MRLLLVTPNEQLHTLKKIKEEAVKNKLEVVILNPDNFSLFLSEELKSDQSFDFCLNRYSSIQDNDHDLSLLDLFDISRHINSIEGIKTTRCKLKQTIWLEKNGYPTIPTLILKGPADQNKIKKFLKNYGNKFISKPYRGNGGRGITLFESPKSLYSYLESSYDLKDQKFLIQPFLSIDFELRVLMMNKSPHITLKKTLKDPINGESYQFKLNLKNNVDIDILELNEIDQNIIDISKEIANKLDLGFCAIDFVFDNSNQFKILEINHMPGWEETEKFAFSKKKNLNIAQDLLQHIIK